MQCICALNLPKDKIIWDVGHQSYTHKILSGRKDNFDGLRQYGGLSGFPKRKESPFDAFDTGHSSTSISAGLGMAQGRDLLGEDYSIVSVIGDGALTGGMAYEALNNAGRLKTNFIIVLNDNNMSISENVGGMSRYLNNLRADEGYNLLKKNVAGTLSRIPMIGSDLVGTLLRTKNSIKQLLIPGMWFENMGITYLGPVDGHDIKGLIRIFSEAKKINRAVLIHVITKKGKGYRPAEKNPSAFHGVEPFDIETGKPLPEKGTSGLYRCIFQRNLPSGSGKSEDRGGDGGDAGWNGAQTVLERISGPLFRCGNRGGTRGYLGGGYGGSRSETGGGGVFVLFTEGI